MWHVYKDKRIWKGIEAFTPFAHLCSFSVIMHKYPLSAFLNQTILNRVILPYVFLIFRYRFVYSSLTISLSSLLVRYRLPTACTNYLLIVLKLMDRVFVFPEDVRAITGRGTRYSQDLLKNLKIILNKEKHQGVTKYELAEYLGINPNLIDLK
jgi:hypothetical protein